jgi:hypothetical protein
MFAPGPSTPCSTSPVVAWPSYPAPDPIASLIKASTSAPPFVEPSARQVPDFVAGLLAGVFLTAAMIFVVAMISYRNKP